jgi:hypothetical protein
METNINISNINKYFFPNSSKIKPIIYRNKIVNYSNISVNEANICHRVKKIPYFSNYFSVLEDYEPLNISQLNEKIPETQINSLKNLKNIEHNEYYLFKYNDKNSLDFIDYVYNSTQFKKLIFDCINSFQHILSGLNVLNENNICFLNISPKNIVFLENYREKPVLKNFRFSLNLNRLDYTYFSEIINNIDDFTYLPIEIHVLYYIFKNNLTTISYSFIEEFCENFIENLSILRLFSEKYKKSYKEQCIDFLRKYINRNKDDIIDDLLERNEKWDIYSISMLFLQIFGCISRVFSLKGTFVSKITIELSKNLHPNSDNRYTIENTLNIFNKYLNEENDWSFVNNIDNNKLPKLFDELSK